LSAKLTVVESDCDGFGPSWLPMPFYSARLLYLILVDDGRPKRRQHADETVIVFRARSYEHGFQRALELGHRREATYKNQYGQTVRWALAKVLTVDFIGASIDGTEVASTLRYLTFPRPLSPRARLHPERSRPDMSAPAGSLLRRPGATTRQQR